MRGIGARVLLALIVASLAISVVFSYGVVVSRNPHAPTKPLYGPSDFVP